jgi:hypothetical protein
MDYCETINRAHLDEDAKRPSYHTIRTTQLCLTRSRFIGLALYSLQTVPVVVIPNNIKLTTNPFVILESVLP